MANADIEINGRAYRLICEAGQEGRIRDLAAYVETRMRVITGGGRTGSDAHMLLATCLVLADELQDVVSGRGILAQRGVLPASQAVAEPELAEMTDALDAVTHRIEEVAARLERT